MDLQNLKLKFFEEGGMWKGERMFWFSVFSLVLSLIFYFWNGLFFPNTIYGVVIFSSLLMLSFSFLFLEHFFTQPKDVLSSTIAIILLLAPIRGELTQLSSLFDWFFFYNFVVAGLAFVSIILYKPEESPNSPSNIKSGGIRDLVVVVGNSKVLFFTLFILTLLFYVNSNSPYFLALFFYSAFLLLINPKQSIMRFVREKNVPKESVGEIFGVQSKNTFLVKLYKNRPISLKVFDFVEFRYSIDRENKIFRGIILDNYLLNKEQWVKVFTSKEISTLFTNEPINISYTDNVVYKIIEVPHNNFMDKFVGVLTEGSTISKIKFVYSSKAEIAEGQLLEVNIRAKKVLYQIVQGITHVESLESKNEMSYVIGEAIQLGVWNKDSRNFEKYGWVPDINVPVYFASPIEEIILEQGEYSVGKIPNTNYPVIMNKQDAITHHIAILGVTGSGKSVFARNLIREVIKDGTKVICIDFTGEYVNKFKDIKPASIVPEEKAGTITEAIEILSKEMSEFKNKRDPTVIKNAYNVITNNFYEVIKNFLKSDAKIAIFELPDVSNTDEILEYTKFFFKMLFEIARKENNFGKKVSVVLEEAHTVIPEWNFIAVNEKNSQALVNSIGQIAKHFPRPFGAGLLGGKFENPRFSNTLSAWASPEATTASTIPTITSSFRSNTARLC